jgi:Flp pilus assembly protein TadG
MKRLSNLRGRALALLHDFSRARESGRAGANPRSVGGRLRAFLHSDSEGQALVEFALVVPALLTILVGIFVVGMVMQNYQQLTYVADQGLMRIEQIPGDSTDAADPCNAIASAIIGAAGNLRTTGDTGIQVSVSFTNGTSTVTYPTSGTTSPTGFSCQDASSYMTPSASATLTVTYPSKVLGFNPTPNGLMTLTQTEQI